EKEDVVRTAIENGDIAHTSQIKLVVEDGEIPDDGPSSGPASEVSDDASQAAPVSTADLSEGDRRSEPERSCIPTVSDQRSSHRRRRAPDDGDHGVSRLGGVAGWAASVRVGLRIRSAGVRVRR